MTITSSKAGSLLPKISSIGSTKVFPESGAVAQAGDNSAPGVRGQGSHGVRLGDGERPGTARPPDMTGES